jgi:hypothetical protein
VEELQISLTPARVEQKNFGLWLRTPQVGQVLNAVVADRLPSGEMVLKVGAERVTASTDIPLQPGARLLLEVKQVQPTVTFRLLNHAPPPNVAMAEALSEATRAHRQISATPSGRGGIPQLLALLGGGQSGALSAAGIDRTVVRQLQANVLNAPQLTNPEALMRAVLTNGTFHERLLATGHPDLMRIAASDLKGQLLKMMAKVSSAADEEGEHSAGDGAGVEALALLRSALDKNLQAVSQNQLASLPAEDNQLSQQWLFDIPFRLGDSLHNLDLELSKDEGSAGSQDETDGMTWRAKLNLDLPGLGATEITLKLIASQLSIHVVSTQRSTLEMFLQAKPGLDAGLESRGLELHRLSVMHAPDMASQSAAAKSLDVRA